MNKDIHDIQITRRSLLKLIGWGSFFATIGISAAASIRFFSPRVLFEPSAIFKIGRPDDLNSEAGSGITVFDRWKKEHAVWIVKEEKRLYAIYAKCTHLGCTPNYFSDEGIFKCPCHGSQFKNNGLNFAGPAPRPLDRFRIAFNEEGEVYVDKSRVYTFKDFDKPGAYVEV